MCGPQHLEHFKDRGEVWACVFPVPGIALDVQQRLREGLLRGAERTRRRCRWLDGVQGPWRGALSLGGRSWLTPRSLHSEGAQRVALGTVRGGLGGQNRPDLGVASCFPFLPPAPPDCSGPCTVQGLGGSPLLQEFPSVARGLWDSGRHSNKASVHREGSLEKEGFRAKVGGM